MPSYRERVQAGEYEPETTPGQPKQKSISATAKAANPEAFKQRTARHADLEQTTTTTRRRR